jgi:hypothetical protein
MTTQLERRRMEGLDQRLQTTIFWLFTIAFLCAPFLRAGMNVTRFATTLEELIVKITLIVYYFCWMGGLRVDARRQTTNYAVAPNQGRLSYSAYLFMIGICAAFTAMCLLRDVKWVIIWLAALCLIDHIGWLFLRGFTRAARAGSLQRYADQPFELMRLQTTQVLVFGKWKILRVLVGGLIIAAGIAYGWGSGLSLRLGDTAVTVAPAMAAALALVAYVLWMEGWIWYVRIHASGVMTCLKDLEEQYELRRLAEDER